MANFKYTARKKDGSVSNGHLESVTKEGAADTLISRGLFPVSIIQQQTSSNWSDININDIFISKKGLRQILKNA